MSIISSISGLTLQVILTILDILLYLVVERQFIKEVEIQTRK